MQNRRTTTRAAAQKKRKPPPRRVQPPTREQVYRVADAMPTPMLRSYVLCMAWSGLRFFEVGMLEWRDVVPREGGTARLHVREGKGYAGVSKERWSVLLEPGVEALMDCVPPGRLTGLVFHTAAYRPVTKQYFRYYWKKAREEVELPWLWTHDLRKFCATHLLNSGATDLDVAVQLGHVDRQGRPNPELVRAVYGYPDLDRALDRVAEIGSAG